VNVAQMNTPPRQAAEVRKAVVTFENFDELVSLLRRFGLLGTIRTLTQVDFFCFFCVGSEMMSRLLGLLGLVLVKIKLLDVTRRLCERRAGISHDGQ
jgi:separase